MKLKEKYYPTGQHPSFTLCYLLRSMQPAVEYCNKRYCKGISEGFEYTKISTFHTKYIPAGEHHMQCS